MQSTLAKFAVLVVCTLLLSACARPQGPMIASPSWSNLTQMQLLFKGDDATQWPAPLEVNKTLLNANNLRQTLDIFGNFPNPTNLGDLIAKIRAANSSTSGQVPGMTGLGGVHGHAFLDVAHRALNANGDFDETEQVIVSVFGQITEYEFQKSSSDPTRGNGTLKVVTYVTSVKAPHSHGKSVPQTEAYRWTVHVANDGFTIVPHSGDPNDPFPNTMEFTPEMLALIGLRGYRYKLWAKGTDIIIDLIEKKAGNSPIWVPLPEANPQYARLYAEIEENCIDMMFVHEPPASLDGMAPPFYCLGRCESPLIVNTGE